MPALSSTITIALLSDIAAKTFRKIWGN